MPYIEFDSAEGWHDYRRPRMTSTKAVSVLLQDDPDARIYKNALEVWGELVGRCAPTEADADEVAWGNFIEDSHRAAVARELGVELEAMPGVWQHPELEWLCASCDGGGPRPGTEPPSLVLCELKAPNWQTAAEWENEDGSIKIPRHVWVQAMVELACCPDASAIYVSRVLPYGPRGGVQRGVLLERAECAERIERTVRLLTAWWERYVAPMRAEPPAEPPTYPPAPKAHGDSWRKTHGKLIGVEEGRSVMLSDVGIGATRRIGEIEELKKALEAEIAACKAQVVWDLGSAERGSIEGDPQAWTYKLEASGKRVLRRVKA